MSFAFIASVTEYYSAADTTVVTAGTLAIASGDLLVGVLTGNADTTLAIDDANGGNAFTMLTKQTVVAQYSQIGYKIAATADAGVAMRGTFGASSGDRELIVLQFRPDNGETVTFEAGDNPGAGSSDSPNSNNISTTGDDQVVIGICVTAYNRAVTDGPTIAEGAPDATVRDGDYQLTACYKLFTTPQTDIDSQLTLATTSAWSYDLLFFRSTAAGGVNPVPLIMNMRRRRIA